MNRVGVWVYPFESYPRFGLCLESRYVRTPHAGLDSLTMDEEQPESTENDFVDIAVDLEWLDSKPRENTLLSIVRLLVTKKLLASARTTYVQRKCPCAYCCAKLRVKT